MAGAVSIEQRLQWRERPSRKMPVMYQTWSDLLFAHWEADPEVLRRTLPAGLSLDTWEGRAFVGIIPFFMRRVRPRAVPPLPWISYFLEMNVRTYVHDASGAPGIWFYSLDCNRALAVWLARALLGLPYQHARMTAPRKPGNLIDYRCRRRRRGATAHFPFRLGPPGPPAEPGTLEFFLLERYLLFTVHHRRLFRAQVHHRPYPVNAASMATHHLSGIEPWGPNYESSPAYLVGSSGVTVEIFAAEPAAT